MLKVVVPLVFMLAADGQVAGKPEAVKPAAASKGGATEAPPKAAAEDRGHTPAAAGSKPAAAGSKAADQAGHKADKPADKDHAMVKRPPSGRGETERSTPPPPGISTPALQEEWKERAGAQKAASERERLESLSSELARTRTALRDETTRLEEIMAKAKQQGATKPPAAAPAPAPSTAPAPPAGTAPASPATTGPQTPANMPVGDPLAPSAYYRPAPPPPNFAVQVEVVSKAMKSMKPEQAAGILGHLERGLAAEVLQRMRPADAGSILGFLKPEVGAALAAEIMNRPPLRRDKDGDKDKP